MFEILRMATGRHGAAALPRNNCTYLDRRLLELAVARAQLEDAEDVDQFALGRLSEQERELRSWLPPSVSSGREGRERDRRRPR